MPYESFNLGDHVGDVPQRVTSNREKLLRQLPPGSQVQWLRQTHGTEVVEAIGDGRQASADACFSRCPGVACAVLSADCLPMLLCSQRGDVVAAAHAGWRGLAAGVLEAAVARMDTPAEQLLVWLGPAIGPAAFEVGGEVRAQFLAQAGDQQAAVEACFIPVQGRRGYFLADIYALARQRLSALGLERVYGGGDCTVSASSRYFSYRRDGETGRMATLIMLSRTPSHT